MLFPGWDASPSRGTQHEVTRSITTLHLDGMLVHHKLPKHEVTRNVTTPPGWDDRPSQDAQT